MIFRTFLSIGPARTVLDRGNRGLWSGAMVVGAEFLTVDKVDGPVEMIVTSWHWFG